MAPAPIYRPALRCHGGKFRLAPWIVQLLPPHRAYLEPWGGAASVLMHKPRVQAECYNDTDQRLVNVFRVLRDPPAAAELARRLALTPYARAELEWAYGEPADAIDAAHRTIVQSFLGHGSDALSRGRRAAFRSRVALSTISRPALDWSEYPQAVPAFTERLAGVVLEQADAVELVQAEDAPGLLIYADPPEGDEQQRALDALANAAAMVAFSCGAGEIEAPAAWTRFSRAALAEGGRRAADELWLNPAAAAQLSTGPRPGRQLFEACA